MSQVRPIDGDGNGVRVRIPGHLRTLAGNPGHPGLRIIILQSLFCAKTVIIIMMINFLLWSSVFNYIG